MYRVIADSTDQGINIKMSISQTMTSHEASNVKAPERKARLLSGEAVQSSRQSQSHEDEVFT